MTKKIEVVGELRMFTFGHFMLSSIQQGIQAAHAITNLFTYYHRNDGGVHDTEEADILYSWATQHETLVCKNGGDTEALEDILNNLNVDENYLPFQDFNESSGALNDSITCIAIVVPERLYDEGVAVVRNRSAEYKFYDADDEYEDPTHLYWLNNECYQYTEFEHYLINLIRNTRHAQ